MDKNAMKRLKGLLAVAEADLMACKAMTKTPETMKPDRLRCHVKHLLENGADILEMLEEPEDESQLTIDLQPVEGSSNGA